MKFEAFIKMVQTLPVIDTQILPELGEKANGLKVQMSRWEKAGKLMQLRRGLYLLADPYRKIEIFELYLAAEIQKPSYISLEKALEFHNLIPEAVRTFTSVTTKRPCRVETALGVFDYRHIHRSLFWGYQSVTLHGQTAFVATPEKSLLDYFYLRHVPVTQDYLDEMRLQSLEAVNLVRLKELGGRFNKPVMMKTTDTLIRYIQENQRLEKRL